jgi:hypothetical protein
LKAGNVFLAQGYLRNALDAYAEAIYIVASTPEATVRSLNLVPEPSLNITDYLQRASRIYETATNLVQTIDATDVGSFFWLTQLATAFDRNGDNFALQGYLGNALELAKASLDIRQKLASAQPANPQLRRNFDRAFERLRAIEQQLASVKAFSTSFGVRWPDPPAAAR